MWRRPGGDNGIMGSMGALGALREMNRNDEESQWWKWRQDATGRAAILERRRQRELLGRKPHSGGRRGG